MLACVSSATLTETLGQSVSVEVHVSNGLPDFTIVGLPGAAGFAAGAQRDEVAARHGRVGPTAADEVSVPAQQRGWLDGEALPARPL
jgi:hypothetical protein